MLAGDKVIPIDIRIICASNKNLFELIMGSKFREDLFFRINILNLSIPSLSERKDDIICLAEYFINKYSNKYSIVPLIMDDKVKNYLLEREYIGNIRELEGLIERCVIMGCFDSLLKEEVTFNKSYGDECSLDLRTYTQNYIEKIYRQTNCSTKLTCDILKINRTTLWKRLNNKT